LQVFQLKFLLSFQRPLSLIERSLVPRRWFHWTVEEMLSVYNPENAEVH